ncbi:HNH endonuclease [Deinococcus phoenicis]|uniref:HNH endonuclease n=1 Tax=Deinococcus phoenicis TaxID=1476583 RepID=UPI0009DCEF2D|nr:HNH endonuclease [Deinococcus phoenicis]
MKEIVLSNGGVALVDDADFEYLSQWKWHRLNSGYAARTGWKKKILMHRELAKPSEGLQVDHIDRNKLNNQRSNLRCVTPSVNRRNTGMSSRNRSGYTGVSFNTEKGKWQAATRIDGKDYLIGRFKTVEDAKEAYDLFVARNA